MQSLWSEEDFQNHNLLLSGIYQLTQNKLYSVQKSMQLHTNNIFFKT